jgi:hypothetical protein
MYLIFYVFIWRWLGLQWTLVSPSERPRDVSSLSPAVSVARIKCNTVTPFWSMSWTEKIFCLPLFPFTLVFELLLDAIRWIMLQFQSFRSGLQKARRISVTCNSVNHKQPSRRVSSKHLIYLSPRADDSIYATVHFNCWNLRSQPTFWTYLK